MSVRARLVAVGAALCGFLATPAALTAADGPPSVGQELTLNGVGIGAQTVCGANGAAEVAFPPAATVVAQTGNFVRIFFSQSSNAGPGSTMLLAVNGQPLLVVPLTSGTAGGGVLETRLPSSLLVDRQPVRLQVRFQLTGPAATLYGRLDGQTLIHYELAGSADGRPELEQYPFSMLAAGSLNPTLGVVLPVKPNEQDLAVAFRVLADLGRRATSQHIRPQVVTADQESWLAAGGVSSLVVGRVGSLPAAPAILTSAGWKQSSAGWTAPDGRALGPNDGLVLAAVSPWDHHSTLLLVTGGSAAAVAKAAAALVSGGGALTGPFVIASAAQSIPPGAARNVRVSVLSPHDLTVFGVGRYRATVGFVVPAVDPGDTAVMELTVPALGAVVPTGSVEVDVNGSWVGSTALASGGARSTRLVASFPGSVVRPGRNSLSLEFRIDSRAVQPLAPDAALPTAQTDTAVASLAMPDPGPGVGDLRLLPFPFLEGDGGVEVVVADAGIGTLGAASQAMLALGSRSAEPPPELEVGFAPGWDGSGGAQGLIVVGSPPGESALATIGAQLPVIFDRPGQVTMATGGSGARVRLSSTVGALQEVTSSDPSGRQVLWLAGTSQDVLDRAAAALYDPGITGNATLVDAAGRLAPLNGSSAASGPAALSTAQAGGVLAAVLILVIVALQLLRPRRAGR